MDKEVHQSSQLHTPLPVRAVGKEAMSSQEFGLGDLPAYAIPQSSLALPSAALAQYQALLFSFAWLMLHVIVLTQLPPSQVFTSRLCIFLILLAFCLHCQPAPCLRPPATGTFV